MRWLRNQEKIVIRGGGVTCDACWKVHLDAVIAAFDEDTSGESQVVCPHCGYRHDDSWEIPEGEIECSQCERKFHMYRDIEVFYSTTRIDEYGTRKAGGRWQT